MKSVFKNNCKALLIFSCHHKVGTSWFSKILSHVSREYNLEFQYTGQSVIKADTDIFFDDHSRVILENMDSYKGVHLIRDPRDVIVSGYYYHKWTAEEWANNPKEHWNGKSYKEKINSLEYEDALLFEMEHVGKDTINEMMKWNYNNDNILEVKYEDLLIKHNEMFRNIFRHYNFNDDAVENCLNIVNMYNFETMKQSNDKHLRKGVSGDWKNHFSDKLKNEYKMRYPGVLELLGYENDDSW